MLTRLAQIWPSLKDGMCILINELDKTSGARIDSREFMELYSAVYVDALVVLCCVQSDAPAAQLQLL